MIVANILQPLIDLAEAVIVFFHDSAGFGWGAAIVALTFATRLVILPLSVSQIRSMRALQAYSPQIKALQERYKDDKQRQQREMIAFYQANKINPFASCLPLLLQLPVFLALYQLLNGEGFKQQISPEGNPAQFLFIGDLAEKETGAALVTLIILFIVTQLGASLVMASRADKNQRVIMFVLPFVFAPFVIGFPAGLAVYWISTNVWTLGQQSVVRFFFPPPPVPTVEEVKAANPPPPPPRKKKKRR
ncbi:MAG: YidC/Oxa1 family membrane protein insertase [Actinomycetota bacterium]|nr:YidC/Oxa1 family membrane protein insertase [Actinomycetota bacterium]